MSPQANTLPVGAAWATTQLELGGPCTMTESTPATSATPSIIALTSPDRVGLAFINLGANNVYIALTSAVGTTNGILLGASGGSFNTDVRDDYTLPAQAWYAVSPAGASTVYVLEVVRTLNLAAVGKAEPSGL